MPTSLYRTTHQPAKRARLTRSSIRSIPLALDIEEGCRQAYTTIVSLYNNVYVMAFISRDVLIVLSVAWMPLSWNGDMEQNLNKYRLC